MIRKLKSGKYRLYSRKKDSKTGKRKNLGTFDTREQAQNINAPCNTLRLAVECSHFGTSPCLRA
jgi:hypothetical protein